MNGPSSRPSPAGRGRGTVKGFFERLVADDLELDLTSLRTPSRRAAASHARALTAYLGKLCGRIPYARTAEYFNRDPSSVAKDVLALEEALRESRSVREQVDRLARSLVKGSAA